MKQRFSPHIPNVSAGEQQAFDSCNDAHKLAEVREWLTRLKSASSGGYHLADVSVGTVIANAGFLLRKLDEKRNPA